MNNGKKKLKKVTLSHSDLIAYLEEMIQMNLCEDYEENAYYDLVYTGKVKRSDLEKIKYRYKEWYHEKF